MLAFDTDIHAVINAISAINREMEKLKTTNDIPNNVIEHHENLACSLVEFAHTILEFDFPIVGKKTASDIAVDNTIESIQKIAKG